MRWSEVRAAYPERWLVIEALAAHSEGGRRVVDRIAVLEVCENGRATMKRHAQLRALHPDRELCFVHTAATTLEIEERPWIGIRGIHAVDAAR